MSKLGCRPTLRRLIQHRPTVYNLDFTLAHNTLFSFVKPDKTHAVGFFNALASSVSIWSAGGTPGMKMNVEPVTHLRQPAGATEP